MAENNPIKKTFQNLQVLEEARNAMRLTLQSEYFEKVNPYVKIIKTVMEANNENHFEAVKRIQKTDLMSKPEYHIVFASALMEIVDEKNLGDFSHEK